MLAEQTYFQNHIMYVRIDFKDWGVSFSSLCKVNLKGCQPDLSELHTLKAGQPSKTKPIENSGNLSAAFAVQ